MSDRLTTHVIVSFWEVRIIDQSLHGLFPNHLYPFIQANPGEFTYNVWACDHMHSHRAKALHVSHLMSFAEQLSGSGNLFPNKSEGLESSADKLVAGYSACLLWWRIYLTSIFLRLFWFSILLHVFFYRNNLSASVADGTSNVRAIQFGSRLQHCLLAIDPTGLIGLADLLSSGADGTFRLRSLPERPGCLCCITRKRWSTRLKRQEQIVVHHGDKNDRMIEWYILIMLWYLMVL